MKKVTLLEDIKNNKQSFFFAALTSLGIIAIAAFSIFG